MELVVVEFGNVVKKVYYVYEKLWDEEVLIGSCIRFEVWVFFDIKGQLLVYGQKNYQKIDLVKEVVVIKVMCFFQKIGVGKFKGKKGG